MTADDDPGLYLFEPSDLPGAEARRAALARHRAESRRLYTDYLATVLIGCDDVADPTERAVIVLDALTVWRRDESQAPCRCSCHPRLPESDFHEYGFGCVCSKSPEERSSNWEAWRASVDAYWSSPQGRAIAAARAADEDDLETWLAVHPEVTVSSHGGLAPEQWEGSVDGHSFYFRERHDFWRIELDLRPTGRFVTRWKGGDLDDDDHFDRVETTEGDVIAEGTVDSRGYGDTPVARVQFIVDMIREHLAPQECTLHNSSAQGHLSALLGGSLRWCPSCGTRLDAAPRSGRH